MNIFKEKKKLILTIFIDIFICILAGIIFFSYMNSTPVQVSSSSDNNDTIIVPNVTEENTKFKISDTKKKVKSVNITATNRLDGYDLYYYIIFDSYNSLDIDNTDYSLLNDTILIIDENCSIHFKYELNGDYSAEHYTIKISNIKISEVTDEKVSEKELKEEKVDKKEVEKESTSPYFIKVNYGANVVTIYTKDDDGKYTVPYKAMVCSCGKYTPKNGTYKTSNKYAWRPLVHNVYGQYATRIVKKILFHSVPYSTNKKDSLLYQEYDKLGTKASEGCIRLTVKDAKWIYDNCPSGTMVEFYSSSNPGPLGKPTSQKISSVEECRNWDPTDPAAENPWRTYKKEEEKPKEENVSNNVTTDITNTTANNNVNENINNMDNNITNNLENEATNSTINNTLITNNTVNNITNENVNDVVINNNSTVDNSISTNSTNINSNITNSTISNSTNNTIDNNTVNNTITNNTTNTNNNSSIINNTNSNNSSDSENNNSADNNTNII